MKRTVCIIMSVLLASTMAACSAGSKTDNVSVSAPTDSVSGVISPQETSEAASSETAESVPSSGSETVVDEEVKDIIDEFIEMNEYEGVVFAKKGGKTIVNFAVGELENGDAITVDTPMPIGSVSKQFCAACVLMLGEEGKLSLDDTLDKYYPDYKEGGKIQIKNLLSMRSGIPEIAADENPDLVTMENTEEENKQAMKDWLFAQSLEFKPDTQFEYVNANFFLLSDIVEQVSGEKYSDFLHSHIFEPLGMSHSGTIGELDSSPAWADGIDYTQIDRQPGLTNGCGDIISNSSDMDKWIEALSSGEVVSGDSYTAMTTSYSDEQYGYGMFTGISRGVGHYGAIGIYSAFDYINEDEDLIVILMSDSVYPPMMQSTANDLIDDLLG